MLKQIKWIENNKKDDSILALCVVSDGDESEYFLDKQLEFVFNLFKFVFGDTNNMHSMGMAKNRKLMQRLLDMLSYFCKKDQSFLVRAIEKIEVPDKARKGFFFFLNNFLIIFLIFFFNFFYFFYFFYLFFSTF